MSRVQESLRNSAVSMMIQAGTILINFVSRTVLIKTLGEQYLGINGLFGNILNMLSLADLGVGTTITYWLYKPMAEKDDNRLNTLMSVYARIYNFIGVMVLLVGLLLAPFLGFFMKETPDIPYLTVIYVLYVLNMASSYFFVYKSSLINVAQKNYIVNGIKFSFFLLQSVLQIIILLVLKNYILYYLCTIGATVCGNIVVSLKAEKMFPFLKVPSKEQLTIDEKREMKKDISAIFSHNFGSFVLNGTDNIIISKFIGVVEVGLYSNYTMIIHAIQTMLNLIFNSLTSSIGNLMNSSSKEQSYEIFKNVLFATSWLVGFCSISLYVLLNPFITLWLGERYVFRNLAVFLIVLNFYLTFIRRPANSFKHCVGLFRQDQFKPYVESAINLIASILLVKKYGIAGVFMGTAISTITVCIYLEPYILYKYFYEKNVWEYFSLLLRYVTLTVLAAVIIKIVSIPISETTIFSFIYQVLLCMVVPNMLFYVCYRKTPEMAYFKGIVEKLIKKILRK